MLRHIVTYKFLPEGMGRTKDENLALAEKLAAKIEENVTCLRGFSCGIGAVGQKESNFDIVLICDFEDFDALAEYKNHPAHKAFGELCHAVSSDRAAIDFNI